MKPRPVHVIWHDAHGDAIDWTPLSDLEHNPRRIVTVGLLVADRKHHYTIASSWDRHTRHVTGVIHIPKVNVQALRELA